MIMKTRNNLYGRIRMRKLLLIFALTYNPNAKRGKKPKYDEMLKIVHPIVIKEKLKNTNDIEYMDYEFAVRRALRFLEEISKIDESKKDYYNIYYHEYFKYNDFERFNIYEVADKYYCSAKKIKDTITDCNSLVHKFILCYKDSDIKRSERSKPEQPYYTFIDDNLNIDEIIAKLKL